MKLKILWFAPYSLCLLEPDVTFSRRQFSHASPWVVSLAKELASRDELELHIATASSGIWESRVLVRKEGVVFHVVRHAFPLTVRGFPEYMRLDVCTRYWALRHGLSQIVKEVQPAIIHAHGTEYGYGLSAVESVPPSIISMQGIVNRIRDIENSHFLRMQARIETQVIKHGSNFGTRTQWASDYVKALNPKAMIYYLPEAVNPLFFKSHGGAGTNRILYVGSIHRRKGIEVLLEALVHVAKRISDVSLTVVGSGEVGYMNELKKRSRQLKIENRVIWVGSKMPEEIAALHDDSALLVHPTLIDNSPNAVAEAMASGLPVVASNVGGIPSMIQHGETGILVEVGHPANLAAAILDLLANSQLRAWLSKNARELAIYKYSPSVVADQAVRVYLDILERQKRSIV